MFEGKNIHLSPLDGKPLCSFSKKLCRQRRLHNFAFCIRHILEDKNSPFKQCPYQTKSGDICINAVPIAASREYCNKHMLMMGLQPKTVKTSIDKQPVNTVSKKTGSKAISKHKITTSSSKNKKLSNSITSLKKDLEKITPPPRRHQSYNRLLTMSKLKRQMWNQQPRSDVMKDLIVNKKYFKREQKKKTKQTSYTLRGSEDDSDDDDFLESFQSQCDYTNSHNSSTKKLLVQLKHRHVQLRTIVKEKMESNALSYSVMSTLVAASRENTTETVNILLNDSNDKVYHNREDYRTTKIPCCMVTGTTQCSQVALPFTRYCRKHINEDSDQLLFVPKNITPMHHRDLPDLKIFRPDLLPKGLKATSFSQKGKRNQNKKSSVLRKGNRKKGAQKKTSKKPNQTKPNITTTSSRLSQKISEPELSDIQNPDLSLSIGTPPVLSESSSSCYTESDSESDILTPEEAFRLPPGSLSYPAGLDDDDSLVGMHHTSRACNIADEEEELIRCGSNFSMDTEKQDMISRELSSPTLNQFSEFDQSLFGAATAFSPTSSSDVALPHTSSLTSPTQEITPLSSNFGSNPKYISKSSSTIKNNSASHTGHGSVTTLKITPLNMSPRKTPSKYGVRSLLTSQSMAKPPLVSNNLQPSTTSTATTTTTKDESWNKQYMQIENFGDPDLLKDMAMDEETPLEKVNPDIFFSSAFPVSTTASDE